MSDILIKGMKIPSDCDSCFIPGSFCPLWINTDVGSRHPDCPLIELPPHGRLIDANEFLKRAIGTKCFRGDYALMLEELVGESTTIISEDAKDINVPIREENDR